MQGNITEVYIREFERNYNGEQSITHCSLSIAAYLNTSCMIRCLVGHSNKCQACSPLVFPWHSAGNRAPVGIYIHAAWLMTDPVRAQQLNDFITYALEKENVWFATITQVPHSAGIHTCTKLQLQGSFSLAVSVAAQHAFRDMKKQLG